MIAALGIGIGAYIGGTLLPRYGSRKLIIGANAIALVFNFVKLIESTIAIILARFVYGTAMGLAVVCLARVINDTIPAKDQAIYGAFVQVGFAVGYLISNLMGLLIPINNGNADDVQKMIDD